MGLPAEKCDLREQMGIAFNASHIPEVPIAAFGAATLAVRLQVDVDDLPIGAAPAAPRHQYAWPWPKSPDDQKPDLAYVASELGALLWHIRYGRQMHLVGRSTALFCEYLMTRRQFAYIEDEAARRAVLEQFAAQVLHEWLSDKCVGCGGSGKQERTRDGKPIRPRGSMQRNATFATCEACHGSGIERPNRVARARCLGLPVGWYEEKGSQWPQRFKLAHHWLHALAGRLHRPLTAETGRRKRRP